MTALATFPNAADQIDFTAPKKTRTRAKVDAEQKIDIMLNFAAVSCCIASVTYLISNIFFY